MGNQSNQENSSFYDQADGKFNQALEKPEKLSKGVSPDEEESEYVEELEETEESQQKVMSESERQVRETEDASLQDETYAFDEQNTGNEEYHDASGADEIDLDNDDDYIQ